MTLNLFVDLSNVIDITLQGHQPVLTTMIEEEEDEPDEEEDKYDEDMEVEKNKRKDEELF